MAMRWRWAAREHVAGSDAPVLGPQTDLLTQLRHALVAFGG